MHIAVYPLRWGDALIRWALQSLQNYAAARRRRRGADIISVNDLSAHLRRDIGLGEEWDLRNGPHPRVGS